MCPPDFVEIPRHACAREFYPIGIAKECPATEVVADIYLVPGKSLGGGGPVPRFRDTGEPFRGIAAPIVGCNEAKLAG